jgi:hypothetical protein
MTPSNERRRLVEIGEVVSWVARGTRRIVAVVLVALVLGVVVLPASTSASVLSEQQHQLLPDDGVGDSPIVP